MHPKWLTRLIVAVLFLFALIPTSLAEEYRGTISFSPEDLILDKQSGFDLPYLRGAAGYAQDRGTPFLPRVEINVAIPTDATVEAIRILGTEGRVIDGRYDIMPVTEALHKGAAPGGVLFWKDPAVYNRNAFFPGIYGEILDSWDLAGQDFAALLLHPLQYNPVTQQLYLATRIDFEVTYREASNPVQETYNFSEKTKKQMEGRLRSMAHNPKDVAPLPDYIPPMATTLDPGNYDYVIITPASFVSYFQNLADWRTQMGMPAKIVDLTWLYANYSGTTNQQRIKNFIKDANTTWGTLYFLLGADTAYLPYHTRLVSGDNIPNDTYYADTDNDWRYEVYVGRACVNNVAQINTFVGKVLTYEKNPPDNFARKVFFMGFDADNNTHGEDCKKKIYSDWVPTTAIFSSEYDSEGGGHEPDVKNYMNQGQNLVNHDDHGDTTILGVGSHHHGTWLNTSEAQNFANGTKYSSLYSVACWVGNYASKCWGEYFTLDDQGGITFVGNSRYGWYQYGNPYTLSGLYDQKWWQALYQDNAYRAGETLAISLNKVYPSDATMKYIFTELNLLGDPTLHFWTQNPKDLTVSHAASINTGSQSFTVNVQALGAPLQDALVCAMKGSEVYAYGTTNLTGDVQLTIDPSSAGTMTLTVTAQNHFYYEGSVDVTVGSNPPVLTDISPRCGLEAGSTMVTLTGDHFTTGGTMTVTVGGTACTGVNVLNEYTLICLTPTGTNGWRDVTVSNSQGSDDLTDGFRYFPTGGDPFNAADIHTESLDAPAAFTLIISGLGGKAYAVCYSFGGGPVSTGWGTMGLDFPFWMPFISTLPPQGYVLIPVEFPAGYGPIDFYIHCLGTDNLNNIRWSYGGNNPNGSGSVWLHMNN